MCKQKTTVFAGCVLFVSLTLCLSISMNEVAAQGDPALGPQTLTRSAAGKDNFTLTFAVPDQSAPYSLLLVNGADDGSRRVRKGWFTLNGQAILTPTQFNRSVGRLRVALRPSQQNELRIKLKGGAAGSFIRVLVEQTHASLLNDPADPSVDADLAGVGTPFSVTIDQGAHRAFISDRHWDSIIEMDVNLAEVTRWFNGVDGDPVPGNGGTTGLCFNDRDRSIVAVNGGGLADSRGSIAIVDSAGHGRVLPISYSGRGVQSLFLALNPENNVASFDGRYSDGRRAYFIDLTTSVTTARDETLDLSAPVFSPATDQFVYAADGEGSPPALFVYGSAAPFQRVKRINSSAPPGTEFDKLGINTVTGVVVAVNQKDAAVYLFDLTAGSEIARLPIRTGVVRYQAADVAVNSQSNTAVVVSRFIPLATVIDLTNRVVAAEIPLPPGTLPAGVAIDQALNRAVIGENGLSSNRRNGSILVLDLAPAR